MEYIERFSIECRETKTKVVTLANLFEVLMWGRRVAKNRSANERGKRGETRERRCARPIKTDADLNPMNQSKRKVNTCSRRQAQETRASKSRLVLVLLLIGCESGVTFLSQSQSVAKKKKTKAIGNYFRHFSFAS